MNVDSLTFGELKEIANLFSNTTKTTKQVTIEPYEIGKKYLIRTVTHYYTGKLQKVYNQELVLSDAAWIPDTDRFYNCLKDGILKEIEPMPQKAQNATVMPMAPIVDKDNLEKNVSLQCRFLGSEKCDPEFPNYSGASIKSADGMMSCNSPGEGQQEQATAVCAIAGGKIQSVYLLNKGKGYSAVPSVKLVGGNGSGCKLEAIVKNGTLQTIKILSKGQNYTSTPDIVIDKPSLNDTCYLCCK